MWLQFIHTWHEHLGPNHYMGDLPFRRILPSKTLREDLTFQSKFHLSSSHKDLFCQAKILKKNFYINSMKFITFLHCQELSQFIQTYKGFLSIVMAAPTDQNSVVPYSQPLSHKRTKIFYIPEDVLENIISFLPAKEVCGLSVLSKRFRHSWKLCRDLSFDSNFARNFSRDEYRSIVNNFFFNHLNTCADRFKLYYDATAETNLVSYWICRAVRLGIKELELDFTPSRKLFMLSYDLVDVESIKIMKLVNCELHLPLNSNGLRHLREITFQKVRARPVSINAIFVNCVSLRAMKLMHCSSIYSFKASAQDLKGFKTLVVKDCSNVDSIEINAPSLRTLHYHGKITEFKFYCDLPYLSDVILEIAHPRGFHLLTHRMEMVTSLAFVKILTVSSTFLEGLSARFEDNEYREMEFFLWKLKEFHLLVAPESFLNPSDIAVFLNKCPSIERLFIDLGLNAFGSSLYWENYGRNYMGESQTVFPFLKHVKIKGFTMKELPVSMARFFLKNAIHLQCLVVVKARHHHFPEIYSPECLRWGIISNARIEIYDYHRDMSTVMPEHLRGV